MTDIINQLNNLSGNTLGEIFFSLNTFIKNNNEDIKSNLHNIFSNYATENHFQKLVKIRLINEFNCYEEVLKALESDSTFYISHVLQCSWFFQHPKLNPDHLVNDIFPYFSFSTRTKLLKKYSKFLKNTELADAIFLNTKHRYGLTAAFTLLPACSKNLVRKILQRNSVQIPIYILINLYKAYPSLVTDYLISLLEAHSTNRRILRSFQFHNYTRLFSLIASNEPFKFSEIMEKYNDSVPYMKLGKRATRHLLHSAFDSYKNHVNLYQRILLWKNVTSSLRLEQISTIYLSNFPRTPTEFFNKFNDYSDFMALILNLKSEKVKHEMILNNFQKTYGKPITDYLNSLSFSQVCFLPKDYIIAWVEQTLPKTEDHCRRGDYTAYLPEMKAISEMKQLILSESDIGIRAYLLKCLIKIISLNDNPGLVGPVFQYLVKRHRNERPVVKEAVIQEFSQFKKLLQISETDWVSVEEFYNLMILQNETSGCSHYLVDIISKQIEFRLERDLPVQEYLEKLIKLGGSYYQFNLCENTRFEKQCLLWFIDWFPEKKHDASTKLDNELDSILKRIFSWNSKHPDDRIQMPEWLTERLEIIFNDPEIYQFRKSNILAAMEGDKVTIHKYYELLFPKYIDLKILLHHLRRKPLQVKENHTHVLKELFGQRLKYFKPFLMQACIYSPFGIPQVFTDYCLKAFHSDKEDSDPLYVKENAIEILSLMLPSNKFGDLISAYYPDGTKLDDFSDEAREKLEIQKSITASIKMSDCPPELLTSLEKFAIGDYVKLVIGSLNSVLLRIPENKILPKLNVWLDSPVSIRKHFIRACFKIAPIEDTLKMLTILFEKETNVSLRLLFLKNSLKFFLREPCTETFSVLRGVIDQLKSADETALSELYNIESIPDEFLSEYLQLLWDKVSTKNEVLISKKRSQIIGMIEPDILKLLSEEFCDVLISEVLSQEVLPLDKMNFVAQYILHSKSTEQQEKRLGRIIPKMKKSYGHWNEFNLETSYVFESRNTFSFFTDALVRESFANNGKQLSTSEFLSKFSSNILSIIEEDNILEEMILLDLARFLISTKGNPDVIFSFSNYVDGLLKQLSAVYGITTIESFLSVIKSLFSWAFNGSDEKFLELSEYLISKTSKSCNLLGYKLLPRQIKDVNIPRYEKLIKIILQNSDRNAKIYINTLLKELRSSDSWNHSF